MSIPFSEGPYLHFKKAPIKILFSERAGTMRLLHKNESVKKYLPRSLPRPALLVEKKFAFQLRILVLSGQKNIQLSSDVYVLHWCPREDSNLHTLRHSHLKAACLPISPPGHVGCTIGIYLFFQVFFWQFFGYFFLHQKIIDNFCS